MSTIDNRIVNMMFNNKEFEQGINESMRSLTKFNDDLNSLGKSSGSLASLSSSVDTIAERFSFMGDLAFRALGRIKEGILDVISSATNMASLVTNPFSGFNDGFAEYEQKMDSMQRILSSTRREFNSEEEALAKINMRLDELNEYADKTIYSFADMTYGVGRFAVAGLKLDDAVNSIRGLTNLAATAGASMEELHRAIIQIGQGLTGGIFRRQDWRSVENASLATFEFKEALVDAAIAAGTLIQQGDKFKTLTTNLKGDTSDWLSISQLFYDGLQYNFLTSDIFQKVLEDYGDVTTEIGKRAQQAAQEVRTFSKMMDSLKESLGSGWSRTFEILVGGFNESKQLWTGINDVLVGITKTSSDARNNMLELWSELGGRTALLDGLKSLFGSIGDILKSIGSAWTNIFPPTSVFSLVNLSKAFKDFMNEIRPSEETLKNIHNIFEGLFAILDMIWTPLKTGIGVLLNFGKMLIDTANDGQSFISVLLKIVGDIGAFIKNIRDAFKTASSFGDLFLNLSNAFKIFEFANFNNIINLLNEIDQVFRKIADSLGLLEIYDKVIVELKSYFVDLVNYLKNIDWNGLFNMLPISIQKYFKQIYDYIKNFNFAETFNSLKESFSNAMIYFKNYDYKTIFNNIKTYFSDAFDYIHNYDYKTIFNNIKTYFSDAFDYIHNYDYESLFEKIKNYDYNTTFSNIKTTFVNIWDYIKNFDYVGLFEEFKKIDYSEIFQNIKIYFLEIFDYIKNFDYVNIFDKIKNYDYSNLFSDIQKYFLIAFEFIKNFDYSSYLDNLKEYFDGSPLIQGLIEGLKNGINKVIEVIKWVANIVINTFKDIFQIHSPSKEFFEMGENLIEGLIEGLKILGPKLIDAFKYILNNMDKVSSLIFGVILLKFAGWIGEILKSVAGIGLSFGKLITGIGLDFSKLVASIAGFITGMGNFLTGLGDLFKESLSDKLLKMGKAIALITASIYVLSTLELEEIITSLAALASVFIGLFIAAKSLSSIPSLKNVGITLAGMGSSLLLLAAAIKAFQMLGLDTWLVGLGKIAVTIAALSVAIAAYPITGNLKITGLGTALIGLAAAIYGFNFLNWGTLINGLGKIIITIAGISLSINNFPITAQVKLGGLALGLLALTVPLAILGNFSWRTIGVGLGSLVTILISFSGALALIGNYAPTISIFKTLIGFATGIAGVAAAIGFLADNLERFGNYDRAKLQQVLAAFVTIMGVMLLVSALGPKAGFALASFALGATAMAGALWLNVEVLELFTTFLEKLPELIERMVKAWADFLEKIGVGDTIRNTVAYLQDELFMIPEARANKYRQRMHDNIASIYGESVANALDEVNKRVSAGEQNWFSGLAEIIGINLGAIWDNIGFGAKAADAMELTAQEIEQGFVYVFSSSGEKIKVAIDKQGNILADHWKSVFEDVGAETLETVNYTTNEITQGYVDGIKDSGEKVQIALKDDYLDVLDKSTSKDRHTWLMNLAKMYEEGKDVTFYGTEQLGVALKYSADQTKTALSEPVKQMVENGKKQVESSKAEISGMIGTLAGMIKENIGAIPPELQQIFDSAMSNMNFGPETENLLMTITDGIKNNEPISNDALLNLLNGLKNTTSTALSPNNQNGITQPIQQSIQQIPNTITQAGKETMPAINTASQSFGYAYMSTMGRALFMHKGVIIDLGKDLKNVLSSQTNISLNEALTELKRTNPQRAAQMEQIIRSTVDNERTRNAGKYIANTAFKDTGQMMTGSLLRELQSTNPQRLEAISSDLSKMYNENVFANSKLNGKKNMEATAQYVFDPNNITPFSKKMATDTTQSITTAFDPNIIQNAAQQIPNTIQQVLSNSQPILLQGARNLANDTISVLTKELSTNKFELVGKQVATGINIGISESQNSINSNINILANDTVDNAGHAFHQTKFNNIGRQIVNGIIAGISDVESRLINRVTAMANRVAAAARQALDIESPSGVFKEIGEYCVEGLAIGLKGTARVAAATAEQVAELIEKQKKRFEAMGDARGFLNLPDPTMKIYPVVDDKQMQTLLKDVEKQFNNVIGTVKVSAVTTGNAVQATTVKTNQNEIVNQQSPLLNQMSNNQPITLNNTFNVRNDNDISSISNKLGTILNRISYSKGMVNSI